MHVIYGTTVGKVNIGPIPRRPSWQTWASVGFVKREANILQGEKFEIDGKGRLLMKVLITKIELLKVSIF